MAEPLGELLMGPQADWETMAHAAEILQQLGVPFEPRIVSAHRTPDLLYEYASSAEDRGLRAIIAGAVAAAHLPGMVAAKTNLPVLGGPARPRALTGIDPPPSLPEIPPGVPAARLAGGPAGATTRALLPAAVR